MWRGKGLVCVSRSLMDASHQLLEATWGSEPLVLLQPLWLLGAPCQRHSERFKSG